MEGKLTTPSAADEVIFESKAENYSTKVGEKCEPKILYQETDSSNKDVNKEV